MINSEDYLQIISKARKYNKTSIDSDNKQIRIAVLGSFSIQYFVIVLRYILYLHGIDAEIYQGEYGGIDMDVLDSESELYKFKPVYLILLPHYTDIKYFPKVLNSEDDIENMLEEVLKHFHNIWTIAFDRLNCQILQADIPYPLENDLGNLEERYIYSRYNYYKRINDRIYRDAPDYVTVVSLDDLACRIGKDKWFDYSSYFLNKSGMKMEYLVPSCELFVRQILSYSGEVRKCLVLDLDNTLWGGVVGDDGSDGIMLDPNNAVGEAYRYFQSYVLRLKDRGVILAICSKNDQKIAEEPFRSNPNMLIHLDDVSCFIANWDDKATNLRRISTELNIGLNSLVFFDDNPAEREIVKKYLPEVYVAEVPDDPADYVKELASESPFEWTSVSIEDISRTQTYVADRKRENLKGSFVDYDDYLKSLDMHASVKVLTENDVPRFTQLLNKSNQFNLRTKRYTQSDIEQRMQSKNDILLSCRLRDKFSEYGIIACAILTIQGDAMSIESLVMSCRVLKRGVEYLLFNEILKRALNRNCSVIWGEYLATQKNGLVCGLLDDLGFDLITESDSKREYYYKTNRPFTKKYYIKHDL